MGKMLADQAAGHAVSEFIEREDGFLDAGSEPGVYASNSRTWPAYMHDGLKLARGRVLDIGCGAGSHAIFLQKKGLNVFGINISPGAVRISRQRGLQNVKRLSITQVDQRLVAFSTILMLGNNFGLFGNPRRTPPLPAGIMYNT